MLSAKPSAAGAPGLIGRRGLDVRRTLLLLAGLAYVLPIWLARFFPTQDGPSHVANAVALADLGRRAIYRHYFQLNLTPVPNWFSHATLAALLTAFPPVVAEKLLVTLYALLFALAVVYLLAAVQGRASPVLAVVGFAFMYNYLLYKGFYNFSFSIPMYLLSVAYWWKHRHGLSAGQASVLAALLLLTYFCHLVALVLALVTIALLALPTLARPGRRRGERLTLLAALAPSLALALWYVLGRSPGAFHHESLRVLYQNLVDARVLATYPGQRIVSEIVLWVLLALLGYALVERLNLPGWDPTRERGRWQLRPADGFYLVAAALAGIYFAAPDRMSGGSFINARLSLFPFLALLPALSPPRPSRLRALFAAAVVLLAGMQLMLVTRYNRALSADLQEFTSGVPAVASGHTLLALSFKQYGALPGNRAGVFEHAVGYYAAATEGIDLGDYEGDTGYFPLDFRPSQRVGIERPDPIALLRRPDDFSPARYAGRVDYIVTWCMPPNAAVAARLRGLYRQVYVSAGQRLRVFERSPLSGGRGPRAVDKALPAARSPRAPASGPLR